MTVFADAAPEPSGQLGSFGLLLSFSIMVIVLITLVVVLLQRRRKR